MDTKTIRKEQLIFQIFQTFIEYPNTGNYESWKRLNKMGTKVSEKKYMKHFNKLRDIQLLIITSTGESSDSDIVPLYSPYYTFNPKKEG